MSGPSPAREHPATLLRANTCVALIALTGILLAGIAQLTFLDPDMLHGMALIRESLEIGRLPLEDRFAYTPTVNPVVHHEWATGAVLYFTTEIFGARGILLLKYVLVAAISVGCVRCARRRGAGFGVLCSLMPIAIVMSWVGWSTIRAQTFTLLLLTVLLTFLDRDRAGRRGWIAPWLLLWVAWVNLHGGFVVGGVLFAAYGAEQLLRRQPVRHLVATGMAMAALTLVNPYGPDYLGYLWEALRLDRGLITEWRPLWEASPALIAVYAMSVVVVAYAVYRSGVRGLPGLSLVALTAWAALRHERHLSIYAVVWLCWVPAFIQPTRLGERLTELWSRQGRRMIIAWVLLAAVGLTAFGLRRPWHLAVPANAGEYRGQVMLLYPVGAVDYLRDVGFRGNLMTPFEVGAFVTWQLHPAVMVSLDGRFEAAYPPETLPEHLAFYAAKPGWQRMLDRYPTDAVLVASGAPLAGAMPQAAEWSRVYRDDAYEIHARPGLALPVVDRSDQPLTGIFP